MSYHIISIRINKKYIYINNKKFNRTKYIELFKIYLGPFIFIKSVFDKIQEDRKNRRRMNNHYLMI